VPLWQPAQDTGYQSARKKNATPPAKARPGKPMPGRLLTQHTGLPPRSR